MIASTDAKTYAAIRYRMLLVELIGGLAVFAAWYASGLSRLLAAWLADVTPYPGVQLAGYLAVFGFASWIVFIPLHWYAGFVVEHRFSLSRMTPGQWVARQLKQAALSGAVSLALMEGFYAILYAFPGTWTLWAAAGWVAVSVLAARVFPTLILPIFYRTTPLADAALARRLMDLCARVGVPALGAFTVGFGAETRKANAALAGLGRTRRVLLADTLLERFTPEEIETVLAHELGHQRHRHITKFLVLSALGSWAAFAIVEASSRSWVPALGLRGLTDLTGFPILMLALSLISLAGLPLQNAISRHFEWESDRFAIDTTRQPAVFAAALRKLGELNLADPSPPRWVEWLFYDHPALPARIRAAEASR